MSIINNCRRVIPSVFKRGTLLEKSCVFRGACSLPVGRSHIQCLSPCFTVNVSSCQVRCPALARHLHTNRFYSELSGETTDSLRDNELSPEETQETQEMQRDNRGLSERPQTFNLDVLVNLLREENAVDICVIKVPEDLKYTEYFIVVSGVSPRHLRGMALYALKAYKFLKKDGEPNVKIEGKDADDWMCLDFGKMVVHFMMPETRDVYELEKLWTLRKYDEQLRNMPEEKLPEDFMLDMEDTK